MIVTVADVVFELFVHTHIQDLELPGVTTWNELQKCAAINPCCSNLSGHMTTELIKDEELDPFRCLRPWSKTSFDPN